MRTSMRYSRSEAKILLQISSRIMSLPGPTWNAFHILSPSCWYEKSRKALNCWSFLISKSFLVSFMWHTAAVHPWNALSFCKNSIAQSITINTESSVRFCMKLCFAISWFSYRRIWHFYSLMKLTNFPQSCRRSSCGSLEYIEEQSSLIFLSTDWTVFISSPLSHFDK